MDHIFRPRDAECVASFVLMVNLKLMYVEQAVAGGFVSKTDGKRAIYLLQSLFTGKTRI